ncbi:TetR/AcrR family transcriptional regulator [Pelagerythrobacter marensis]|uniref:TetR/AcrR family transcriptional regulator n=1 Tax=Pelagerythrobacter marensis TaxID=543877 RepID=A0ABZ2DB33_9SPHN
MSIRDVPSSGRRLSREERRRQLLEVARDIVRSEGNEALTLGYLAQRAGVSKPIPYDHFGSRTGLLAALYRAYDDRQNARMAEALAAAPPELESQAAVIADSYVACVVTQGSEIPGVSAALAGSAELEAIRLSYESGFMERVRTALARFSPTGEIALPALRSILGAAEALSFAAVRNEISQDEATSELSALICDTVRRAPDDPRQQSVTTARSRL